ncbi:MAG: CbtB-domain containing protein [Planctomycetales bacterium]
MSHKHVLKQARDHVRITSTLKASVFAKGFIILAIAGLVLHALLFTTYPPVHDYFHELRHSLMAIPCH